MSLIAAKCSQCGANIEINSDKKFGYCPNCGTKYITEEITKQYITNVEHQTNIYFGEDSFETERKQCEVLLICLKNRDFNTLKQKSLNILELNPKNELAQMIYKCNFQKIIDNTCNYIGVSFQFKPVTDYFINNQGKINLEFSQQILDLIKDGYPTMAGLEKCLNSIFDNVDNFDCKENDLISFYSSAIDLSMLDLTIDGLQSQLSSTRFAGFKTLLFTNNEYLAADMDEMRSNIKNLFNNLNSYRNKLSSFINNRYKSCNKISDETRTKHEEFKKEWDAIINGKKDDTGTKLASISGIFLGVFLPILFLILVIIFLH